MGLRIVVIALLVVGLASASRLGAEPDSPLKILITPALGDADPGTEASHYEASLVNTGRRALAYIAFCDSTGSCVFPEGLQGCVGVPLNLGEGCAARFTPEVPGYHYAWMLLVAAVQSGAPVDGRGSLQASGTTLIQGAVSTQ